MIEKRTLEERTAYLHGYQAALRSVRSLARDRGLQKALEIVDGAAQILENLVREDEKRGKT